MGWFSGGSLLDVGSRSSYSTTSRKSRGSGTVTGSVYGQGQSKHNGSRASIFGGLRNVSRASVLGRLGNGNASHTSFYGRSSSSYYKRSPRSSFIAQLLSKLRQLLRELMYYMKKHPVKVFILVIMPLITGGALTALLAKFGIRLPGGIQKALGIAGGAGGKIVDKHFGQKSSDAGMGNVLGGLSNVGSFVNFAKRFV